MTRKEKVIEFFKLTGFNPYWCKSIHWCACCGCVNINSYANARREWYKLYADPFLTEEDIKTYNEKDSTDI